ncbi:MAG: hypothetical protein ABL927_04940 [Bdellovibrionales bacterium]
MFNLKELYKKSFVAFQCVVPIGSKVTIIKPVEKAWYDFYSSTRYYVQLNSDLSRGLDVILELNRGLEGTLDGLNPYFFSNVSN